jgi:NADPH:quinone reductase
MQVVLAMRTHDSRGSPSYRGLLIIMPESDRVIKKWHIAFVNRIMRYISYRKGKEAGVLAVAHMPVPEPAPGQVLIKVFCAGVNRPDILQCQGFYPPPADASPVLGLEVAGHIAAIGAGVSQWRVGDCVCALTPGGGYAEFCLTDAMHCLPVPHGLSLIEAAALPENTFTVWYNLFQRGNLQHGGTILVHGGSGGIGSAAIQVALARGITVYTTVRSAQKAEFCHNLGAHAIVIKRECDFENEIARLTGGIGVSMVLDILGGEYTAKNLRCLATGGHLVQIAYMLGRKAQIDLAEVMSKRLTITGSTLRSQSNAVKAEIAKALYEQIWPMITAGRYRALINQVLPLEEAQQAHKLMESDDRIGKIMLVNA